MKRKSSEFRREAVKEPFELELDDGGTVVFRDPSEMSSEDAFRAAKSSDPEEALRLLLGHDWVVFWQEWRHRPVGELTDLNKAVGEHYDAGE